MSKATAALSCSITFLMRNCLATPRRWSVSVSDLPDAVRVAAYRRTRPGGVNQRSETTASWSLQPHVPRPALFGDDAYPDLDTKAAALL
jgi:hypothetical protein